MQINKYIKDELEFIKIDDGDFNIVLCNLGASIYHIDFDSKPMTIEPINIEDFKKLNAYYGKTIGPVANRIKNGKLILEDQVFEFPINEEPNSLHSGKDGISAALFKSEIIKNEGNIQIIYRLKNGRVEYSVLYTIKQNATFTINFLVKVNSPYPISLTNHAYFCLGELSIENLSLYIPSSKYIETGKTDLLPLYEKEVTSSLDFRKEKSIIKDINDELLQNHRAKGYDHCFLLDDTSLYLKSKKYTLTITTDFQAVQIYSFNYSDDIRMYSGQNKTGLGVAIEPEDNLLNKTLTKDIYQRSITYSFKKN